MTTLNWSVVYPEAWPLVAACVLIHADRLPVADAEPRT